MSKLAGEQSEEKQIVSSVDVAALFLQIYDKNYAANKKAKLARSVNTAKKMA